MTDDDRFRAVVQRDQAADGQFVYAVTSTGIYCRPSCPSRKPGRHRMRFFPVPEAARQAGFRACRRCRPDSAAAADPQLAAVRRACRAIERHLDEEIGPPRLEMVAAAAGLSPFHLQRVFKRIVGITPRAFADARRLRRLKAGLREANGVADAVYQAGYGSASRVYERADAELGMTPATYAEGGRGAEIRFAVGTSVLGRLLVAATAHGVCMVSLGDDDAVLEAELRSEYPAAVICRDQAALGPWLAACLAHASGSEPDVALPLDVRATAFQWRVWQALQAIPRGETRTYQELAAAIGQPGAARAVGRACATNLVSLAIPCHRAIRTDGGLGGYRWGLERKRTLLEVERQPPRRRSERG